MRCLLLGVFLFCCTLVLVGCGPTKHPVTGTVNYNGASLPEGDIIFRPKDAKGAADSGKVKDGKYLVKVKPGNYIVEIQASKLMPLPEGQKAAMGETEANQTYIPEKYNSKSELSAEVSGPKEQNFDLKSK